VRRLAAAAAVVVLGALASAPGAQACSCLERPPSEALRDADAAVVGTLVEVVVHHDYGADYRYRLHRVYKGPSELRSGRTISVRSARHGAACGLPSAVGRRYGLYLGHSGGGWRGSLCGLFDPAEMAAVARAGVHRNSDLDVAAAFASTADCAS
jgi:hypothetical protein